MNTTLADFYISDNHIGTKGRAALLAALQVRQGRANAGGWCCICGGVVSLECSMSVGTVDWSISVGACVVCVSVGAGQCGVDHVSRSGPG